MCAPFGVIVKESPSTKQTNSPAVPPPHVLALSVEEAAAALGIGRTMVFYLLRDGKLRAIKIGKRTLIPVREIESFLARLLGEVVNG